MLSAFGVLSRADSSRSVTNALELFRLVLQKLFDDAPLTINFNAASWFGSQAGFDEYITVRRSTNLCRRTDHPGRRLLAYARPGRPHL